MLKGAIIETVVSRTLRMITNLLISHYTSINFVTYLDHIFHEHDYIVGTLACFICVI